MKPQKTMTLNTFLELYGVPQVAEKLGITEQAVYRWKRNDGRPNLTQADKLIELSEGQLDHNSIYFRK